MEDMISLMRYLWTISQLSSCYSATAQSVETMIIGRLLAGIGIGISSAIVPLYISEVPTRFDFLLKIFILYFSYNPDPISAARSHQLKSEVHLDRSTNYLSVSGFLQHW